MKATTFGAVFFILGSLVFTVLFNSGILVQNYHVYDVPLTLLFVGTGIVFTRCGLWELKKEVEELRKKVEGKQP